MKKGKSAKSATRLHRGKEIGKCTKSDKAVEESIPANSRDCALNGRFGRTHT
jgi:hypothetical protein